MSRLKFIVLAIAMGVMFQQNSWAAPFYELIGKAKERSPVIQGAQLQMGLSEKNLNSKRLFVLPQVSGRIGQSLSGNRGEEAGVQFDLNLWKSGSDVAALRSAYAEVRAQSLDAQLKALELEAQVAEVIFQYLVSRSELKYRERLVGIKLETLRASRERFRRGQLSDQEVLRARLEHEQAEASVLDSRGALRKLEDQLRILTGESNFTRLDWPWKNMTESNISLNPRRKGAKAPQNLEGLLYQAKTESSQQKYWSTKLAYFPRLSLVSDWSNNRMDGTGVATWSSALTVSIPLWDNLLTYTQARSYLVESETLKARYQLSEFSFQVTQESLGERMEMSRRSAKMKLSGLEGVKKLFDDSLRRFQTGRGSLNDLFLDESRYLQVEAATQQALASFHRQMIEVCHSSGESVLNCFH